MNENSPNQQPVSLAITILLVTLSFALCLAWFWQMVFVIPEFDRMFADFKIKVPALTQATISCSRVFVKFWYVLVPFSLFIVYPAIGCVSYQARHRNKQRGLCRLWFILIIGLPLVVQTITLLAVLSTHATLMEGLSGVR
jgi:type II secretory pathway component PulF